MYESPLRQAAAWMKALSGKLQDLAIAEYAKSLERRLMAFQRLRKDDRPSVRKLTVSGGSGQYSAGSRLGCFAAVARHGQWVGPRNSLPSLQVGPPCSYSRRKGVPS